MLILKNTINQGGIHFGGSEIILNLAGKDFGDSQRKLFLVGTNFGGFVKNPPKIVPTKISILKAFPPLMDLKNKTYWLYLLIKSFDVLSS